MHYIVNNPLLTLAQISVRQTPGLTRGSHPFYITYAGGEPRVKPGAWRPEMWNYILYVQYCYIRPQWTITGIVSSR
jgi:hypothetical protein